VNRAEVRRAIAAVVSLAKAYQGEHSMRGVAVELWRRPRGGQRALAAVSANSGEAGRRAMASSGAVRRAREEEWGEQGGRARC
jgi:hypothetical protein